MHSDKIKEIFSDLELKPDNSFLPLKTENLSYFIDEKEIISDLNINIFSDEITIIMGPNGAGKSIFLKLLNGIIKPTSGNILWNKRKDFSFFLGRQALVFQKPILLRRSVAANLDFIHYLTNIKDK